MHISRGGLFRVCVHFSASPCDLPVDGRFGAGIIDASDLIERAKDERITDLPSNVRFSPTSIHGIGTHHISNQHRLVSRSRLGSQSRKCSPQAPPVVTFTDLEQL